MDKPWVIREAFDHIDWRSNACTTTTGIALLGLIASTRARVCIEIGIFRGFTTSILGWGLSAIGGGLLLSCDIYEGQCADAARLVEGAPNLTFRTIAKDSARVNWPEELAKHGEREVCIAYVDGCHDLGPVSIDIAQCSAVVKPGGFLVCHDYTPKFLGVMQAADAFYESQKWNRIVLPYVHEAAAIPSVIFQRPGG